MTRWKAAASHLGISAIIAALAAAVLFGLWYPPPYFRASGADELLFLLGGVDLVLGPLLTLIVFRTGKPSLRFDLSVIALVQASALLYGMWVMVQSRPVFLVGTGDRFVLVGANELDRTDLAQGRSPAFRTLSWTGPRLVGALPPKDAEARNALMFSAVAGKDIERYPRYYVPYAQSATRNLRQAKPLSVLLNVQPSAAAVLDRWLAGRAVAADSVVWLPVVARRRDVVLLLNKADGAPLDALAVSPW